MPCNFDEIHFNFENLNNEFNLKRAVVGRGEHCQRDKFGYVSARGENRMGGQDLQMYHLHKCVQGIETKHQHHHAQVVEMRFERSLLTTTLTSLNKFWQIDLLEKHCFCI